MKKILIVEVPDGSEINSIWINKVGKSTISRAEFKELHLATEEEIDIMAHEKPKFGGHIANRRYGAKWLKRYIEQQ